MDIFYPNHYHSHASHLSLSSIITIVLPVLSWGKFSQISLGKKNIIDSMKENRCVTQEKLSHF